MRDVMIAGGVFLLLAAGVFAFIKMGGLQATERMKVEMGMKRWMKAHVADGNAEIVSISEPEVMMGSTYRLARYRALNKLGGPVIDEVLLRRDGSGGDWSVITAEDLKEWAAALNPSEAEKKQMDAAMGRMSAR